MGGKKLVVRVPTCSGGVLLVAQRVDESIGKILRLIVGAEACSLDVVHGHAAIGFGGAHKGLAEGESLDCLDRDAGTRNHRSKYATRRVIDRGELGNGTDEIRAEGLVEIREFLANGFIDGTNDLEFIAAIDDPRPNLFEKPLNGGAIEVGSLADE